jgi:hypothetical protein
MAGGARGVEDLGERARRAVDRQGAPGFGRREPGEVAALLAGGQRQNGRLLPRRLLRARDRVDSEGDDEASLGVPSHEGVFRPGEGAEQRHQHATGGRDGDDRLDVLDPILLYDRDALARREAQSDESPRQARRALVELAVGATSPAVDQGDPIRPAHRGTRRIVGVGMDHLRSLRRSGGRCRSAGPA